MRHKILIVSAATLFTLSSCGEDFLYKAPQGSIDQEALTNAEGVELLVVNAYAGLTRPTGYDNMFNWVFGGVYGGDANKGSESNDQSVLNSVETYAVTATNDYLQNKWKDAYYGAQRCNLALNVMKEAADMDETTKAYRTAELKFLRALFMFEGVKIFGPTGMPYIDETIAAEENDPKVHNGTDIYPNILADVEAAIEGLPEKQTEVARPTKTAAKALKAKILMQQGDMTAAKPILADIIANGLSPKGERLALQDDLDANFNATTENGKESIFEVQFSVGANNNGNYGFLLNYPHNTGPGGCCGFYQPSYELVNSFQVDENGLPYLDGEYRNKKSVTERVTDYDYISKNDKTIAVEQKDLEKRLAECPDLRNVYEQLQSGETLKVAFGEYQKYSSKKAYQSFLQSIGQMESKGRKSRSRRVGWYAAAAVVTLAVALSFYMSNYISSEKEGKTLIQPGTQQAQLTLSDGSVIDVHRKEVSVVVDGVQVKYKKGVLSYQPTVTTHHE